MALRELCPSTSDLMGSVRSPTAILLLEVHAEKTGDNQHKLQQEKLWLNTGRKKFHSKFGQSLGQMPVVLCILRGTETQMDATLRYLI